MRAAPFVALAFALVTSANAGTESARLLEPDATLAEGEGAVLLVVRRDITHSAVIRGEELVITLLRLEDKARFRLDGLDEPKLFALPAGHYTIKEAYLLDRTIDVQNVTKGKDQAFEVVAGKLNYAGSWTLAFRSTESTDKINVDVKFAPEPLQAMVARFDAFVATHPVSLSPAGKPAQPLGGKK